MELKKLTKELVKGYNFQGIYRIYLFNNKNKPQQINRFCNIDYSGLIYIGCTYKQNVETRLLNFIRSMENLKTNNHSGGNKISKFETINNLITENILMFECKEYKNSKIQEFIELEDYISKFGEKPPLNG